MTRGTEEEDRIGVAVIGKPNVGKSSLINALIQDNRVIVSPIAGTTRDSVDTPFSWNGDEYTLIDTAGIRRKSKVYDYVEKYSVIRAIAAVERADVCIVMMNAQDGVTEQDKKIAGLAHEAGKGIVLVVNKWDLIEKETNTMRDFIKNVESELQFCSYAPIIFTSVTEKLRLNDVMAMAHAVAQNRAQRVPTGQLNSLIADAVMMKPTPSDKGKAPEDLLRAHRSASSRLCSCSRSTAGNWCIFPITVIWKTASARHSALREPQLNLFSVKREKRISRNGQS
jgi:GTP-binding protein